jgi:hypothetical protein
MSKTNFDFTNLPKELLFNKEEVFNININREYKDLINDLYKFIVVFLSLTILLSYSDSALAKLVEQSALEVLVFVVIGLCAYHLVLKKLVTLS